MAAIRLLEQTTVLCGVNHARRQSRGIGLKFCATRRFVNMETDGAFSARCRLKRSDIPSRPPTSRARYIQISRHTAPKHLYKEIISFLI